MRIFEIQGPAIAFGRWRGLTVRFYVGTDTKHRPLVITLDVSDDVL